MSNQSTNSASKGNTKKQTDSKSINIWLEKQITQAWQRQDRWLYLLSPLSGVYAGISGIRKQLYQRQLLPSYRAKVPVMIVGNITVGGAGKTPLIIALVTHLQAKGVRVGVISRGYGGDYQKMPAIVGLDSTPEVVGDEPCLIVRATQTQQSRQLAGVSSVSKSDTGSIVSTSTEPSSTEPSSNVTGSLVSRVVPMAVCPNRQQAIECLLQTYPDVQLIIADDGLQHYKLQRDIEWVVVDSQRGFGNGWLLPVGFLREPIRRLQNTTVIYNHPIQPTNSHQNNQQKSHPNMWLKPNKLQPLLDWLSLDTHELDAIACNLTLPKKGDAVYAVSGIGYPQRFFATLQQLGYQVMECPYPDHHQYGLPDLLSVAAASTQAVVITSKDAVKIQYVFNQYMQLLAKSEGDIDTDIDMSAETKSAVKELLSRMFVLPVTAQLNTSCIQQLEKQLQELGIVIH